MANGYFRIGTDNIKYAGDSEYNLNYPLIKPVVEAGSIILPKLVLLDSGIYAGLVDGVVGDVIVNAPIVLAFSKIKDGGMVFERSVSTGTFNVIFSPADDVASIGTVKITYSPANV